MFNVILCKAGGAVVLSSVNVMQCNEKQCIIMQCTMLSYVNLISNNENQCNLKQCKMYYNVQRNY